MSASAPHATPPTSSFHTSPSASHFTPTRRKCCTYVTLVHIENTRSTFMVNGPRQDLGWAFSREDYGSRSSYAATSAWTDTCCFGSFFLLSASPLLLFFPGGLSTGTRPCCCVGSSCGSGSGSSGFLLLFSIPFTRASADASSSQSSFESSARNNWSRSPLRLSLGWALNFCRRLICAWRNLLGLSRWWTWRTRCFRLWHLGSWDSW